LLFLSQRFSFWFIKLTTDALFLYDTPEGKKIKDILYGRRTSKVPIFYVKNGINEKVINEATQPKKQYEACFLGGIRYSKGIEEFVPIWKRVLQEFPRAKFLVIGGGSEEIVSELKNDIKNSSLDKNIIMTGPLSHPELFKNVKSAKLFLFPSHEEGWGIALCEAMYCGLPIICYDLPAFQVFGNVIDKYPLGDYEKLAKKVINYLSHEEKITSKKDSLINTAVQFTWKSIAAEEKKIFNKIIGG
jgi:glycosyltransferase involved in cell wall biosynthesis